MKHLTKIEGEPRKLDWSAFRPLPSDLLSSYPIVCDLCGCRLGWGPQAVKAICPQCRFDLEAPTKED